MIYRSSLLFMILVNSFYMHGMDLPAHAAATQTSPEKKRVGGDLYALWIAVKDLHKRVGNVAHCGETDVPDELDPATLKKLKDQIVQIREKSLGFVGILKKVEDNLSMYQKQPSSVPKLFDDILP